MKNDFRAAAAAATFANLRSAGINALAASPNSGCLFVGGLRAVRLCLELAALAIILICFVLFLAGTFVSMKGALSHVIWSVGSLAALIVLLFLRKVKELALRAILLRRTGGF